MFSSGQTWLDPNQPHRHDNDDCSGRRSLDTRMSDTFQGGNMKKYVVPAFMVAVLFGLVGVLIWLPKPNQPSAEAPVAEPTGEESAEDPSAERLITIQSEGKPAQVC